MASITEFHKNIQEITKDLRKHDPQIPDTSKKPLASRENSEDLIHSDLGKPVRNKPFSFDEELKKKVQSRQVKDSFGQQTKSTEEKIDNHAKRIEELKQKQKELEERKKGLEEKKANSNITREERWKIAAELEAINNQFKAIEKEHNTTKSASDREKKFDYKNKHLTSTKREPTAADLQQQGALAAIKRMKEEKIKQQQAEAVNQSSKNTPTMPSGTIPMPPPMPGSSIPIPTSPPPPPISIPKTIKKEAKDIGKQMPQGGDKHKEELAKAMKARREKIGKQNSGRRR
ncbi:hypothetical protein O6R16_03355 [Candidatus Rickettsia tasmanensis]